MLVTRTPPEPPGEELDELDEEAIVAQQSAAHAPQRRAQIKVESRSVVVADDDAEATRQLQVYTEGTSDPTVVVRDRERRALEQALDELPALRPARKSWVTFAIWGGAGLVALGLGVILGLRGAEPVTVKQTSVSSTPAAAPVPAPAETHAAAQSAADATPAPSESTASEPALAPDQLPVEPGKQHKSTVHARPARPAVHPAAKPAAPKTQPEKGAIPSGI